MFNFYQYITSYWWPPSEEKIISVQYENDGSNRVSSVGKFGELVETMYPDLDPSSVKYIKQRYYKIHRQLTVNPEFRRCKFDKSYLAAKLSNKSIDGLTLSEQNLIKNNKLWSRIMTTLAFNSV